MGRRTNNKGRNKGGGRFVSLPHAHMDTDAWKALNSTERDLFICIKRRFNGSNNGNIGLSLREACEYLNCGKQKAIKAFKRLEKVGFIEAVVKGAFDWKTTKEGKTRSTRWSITCEPRDYPDEAITAKNTFKTWKPTKAELVEEQAKKDARRQQTTNATQTKKKKSRVRSSNPSGTSNEPINVAMGSSNEPSGYVKRTDRHQNQNFKGTLNGPVCNLPYTSAAQASGQSKRQAQPCASCNSSSVNIESSEALSS